MGDATKPQTMGTIIPFEPIDKGGIYYTTDRVMTPEDREWLCEMAMKGVRVYVHHPEHIDIWYSTSNPDQSDFNQLKNITGKVIAFQHGKPTNPPPCPPGGCQ